MERIDGGGVGASFFVWLAASIYTTNNYTPALRVFMRKKLYARANDLLGRYLEIGFSEVPYGKTGLWQVEY